jgi:deoxyadenosine/deoxycytidine kinase
MRQQTQSNKKYSSKIPLRIEICGGIASGKTTLAALMGKVGLKPIFENYQSNPFLESFYTNTNKYAFEAEITFLLLHYNLIKVNLDKEVPIICDYSLFLDLAYSLHTLSEEKLLAYNVIYSEILRELELPQILIYLHCSAFEEMKRINKRNRAIEQSISINYLEEINKSLEKVVYSTNKQIKIVQIDSEKLDFAKDKQTQKQVIDLIYNSFLK